MSKFSLFWEHAGSGVQGF